MSEGEACYEEESEKIKTESISRKYYDAILETFVSVFTECGKFLKSKLKE